MVFISEGHILLSPTKSTNTCLQTHMPVHTVFILTLLTTCHFEHKPLIFYNGGMNLNKLIYPLRNYLKHQNRHILQVSVVHEEDWALNICSDLVNSCFDQIGLDLN